MSDNTFLARALFDAFQSGDTAAARALLSPEFRGSQNGGPQMDADTLLAFSGAVYAKVANFRYEEIMCEATPSGFVEEHTVRGQLPDGGVLDLRLCVVGTVEGGQITELREYLDSAGAVGLAKALAG
ncbi:nuclear transport factor 2 family protein [Erythrobacter sp. NAP1]|uniref:nuclear transport factor 2 family protein n=1 Tax=Erythrobacter sp. NAP1 TaxID=237727 RepID=UPI0002FED55E|nr:nuclear transport factor 2 family protein [Erythrobacter sp. NAP1]